MVLEYPIKLFLKLITEMTGRSLIDFPEYLLPRHILIHLCIFILQLQPITLLLLFFIVQSAENILIRSPVLAELQALNT